MPGSGYHGGVRPLILVLPAWSALPAWPALWASAITFAWGCAGAPPPEVVEIEREVAGIYLRIHTRDGNATRSHIAIESAFTEAERVADQLLAGRMGSEISILNSVPSHVAIEVAPETAEAIRLARRVAEDTGGAFDPTLLPLLRLWGLIDGEPHVPRDYEITSMLRRVDWQEVEVEDDAPVVQRTARSTQVDLMGVARGAVIDAALAVLAQAGVPAARVGDDDITAVYGGTPNHQWLVPVSVPDNSVRAIVRITDGAMAMLWPHQSITTNDGSVIHELIDPRSGRPATHNALVVVTASDARSAAAYARALFVMHEGARAFLQKRSQLQAVILPANGQAWSSPEINLSWQ